MQRKVIASVIAFNTEMDRAHNAINTLRDQIDGIIYVDNSPDPACRKALKALEQEYPGFVTYIGNRENIGIGASHNVGAKEAIRQGADWVMTMEDDNQPTPDMVKTMFNAYDALSEKDKVEVASIGPNYTRPEGVAYSQKNPFFADGTITSAEIVKTSTYEKIGWYNNFLFIDFVDGEFAWRLSRGGFKTLIVPQAMLGHRAGFPTILHFPGKTVRVSNYPPYRYYFMTRNGWYLCVRNFKTNILHSSHWLDAIYATIFPRYFIKAILFEKKKGKKIKMWWRGFWDGILGRMDVAYARERAGLPNVPAEE